MARPRWIALTLGIIVLVVVMVNLGFWQLRRLDDRRAANAEIRSRTAQPVQEVASVVPTSATLATGSSYEWREVTATGTYDTANQVLVRNRSQDGHAGFHVLTPLRLNDGRTVIINRGFVAIPDDGSAFKVAPAPPGSATVVGRVRATQVRGSFGPRDPAQGHLSELSRADLGRLAQQLPYTILPVYIELESQQPALVSQVDPAPIPPPELNEGPHLSYAIQWFLFSALAILGWVVVVRREIRGPRPKRVTIIDEMPTHV